jgi:hypothetical protein
MKKLLLIITLELCLNVVYAKKSCTTEPKEKWMTVESFKKKAESEGYKIKTFKETGTCYEIYGQNKEGKKVEIYFSPVDGSIVKSK